MIAGVVDTCNKFLTGVNDTGQQLSPVTTPAINLSQVTTTPVVSLTPVNSLLAVSRKIRLIEGNAKCRHLKKIDL